MNEPRPRYEAYVLDASVALKWFLRLPDEPYTTEAIQLLQDFQEGRIGLLSPSVVRYEVGHALMRAFRRERITFDQAQEALLDFLDLGVPTVYDRDLLTAATVMSRDYGISFYDANYAALSFTYSLPLIHADQKLRANLEGRLPLDVFVDQYPSLR